MAQIDLRHADIYIKDGYTKTGLVNGSPANGNSTVIVDGFTAALPIGAVFTVAGSTNRYTITGTTGGSTPTVITFTPPFATGDGIPVDDAAITVGPNILKVKIGEGNLTYEEKRNINYIREKRSITNGFVMTGDDEPVDVSLDLIWEYLSADTIDPPTVEEALNQKGQASLWVSAGSDPCEPYAVNLEIIYLPPCSGVKAERILLEEYRWESLSHDLKAGTMSTKGKCKMLLSSNTRETQTGLLP